MDALPDKSQSARRLTPVSLPEKIMTPLSYRGADADKMGRQGRAYGLEDI